MAKNWLRSILLFSCLVLLGSCTDCEDLTERRFKLIFFQNDQLVKPVFEQMHGLSGNGLLQPEPADTLYYVPMSLHADSSTFVLVENAAIPDTLTITYKRDFFYEGQGCGFRVRFSDFGIGATTTYDSAVVVTAQPLSGWGLGYSEEVNEVRIYR